MQIKDAKHGQTVVLVATVLEHKNGGQTMLALSGLGKTGRWSAPGNAECAPLPGGSNDT